MSPVSPPTLPPGAPSSIPKVFGIIHICYAALGAVGALLGIVSILSMKLLASEMGGEIEGLRTMSEAYDGMAAYTYVDAGLKLALAILLLVSGVGLLKRRAWALKTSVCWAVSRIVIAVLMVVWQMQVMQDFQRKLGELQAQAPEQGQEQLQQMGQNFGTVIGVIFLLVYPVICLIFLSRKSVRESMNG